MSVGLELNQLPFSEDAAKGRHAGACRVIVPESRLACNDRASTHSATDGTLLDSALELSSSLLAKHAASQSTIFALELKVSELETLVKTTQLQPQPRPRCRSDATPFRDAHADAYRVEEVCRGPVVIRSCRMGRPNVNVLLLPVKNSSPTCYSLAVPSRPRLRMNTITTLLNRLKINESTFVLATPVECRVRCIGGNIR